jgi:hypothetical protein
MDRRFSLTLTYILLLTPDDYTEEAKGAVILYNNESMTSFKNNESMTSIKK